jgi:hypothetical protein
MRARACAVSSAGGPEDGPETAPEGLNRQARSEAKIFDENVVASRDFLETHFVPKFRPLFFEMRASPNFEKNFENLWFGAKPTSLQMLSL